MVFRTERKEAYMKKIVFVNASLTQGGSERAMTNIANYCATNGYNVEMILLRKNLIHTN